MILNFKKLKKVIESLMEDNSTTFLVFEKNWTRYELFTLWVGGTNKYKSSSCLK